MKTTGAEKLSNTIIKTKSKENANNSFFSSLKAIFNRDVGNKKTTLPKESKTKINNEKDAKADVNKPASNSKVINEMLLKRLSSDKLLGRSSSLNSVLHENSTDKKILSDLLVKRNSLDTTLTTPNSTRSGGAMKKNPNPSLDAILKTRRSVVGYDE
jgi:hypothetical protein